MNNKAFKDENLGNVLQSGIEIYTNMDKDVQKTLQNDVDNGSFYKNKDQQVGATILDSKTGGLVAIYSADVISKTSLTETKQQIHTLLCSSLKPFLAYGPAIEHINGQQIMRFKMNLHIQVDEYI